MAQTLGFSGNWDPCNLAGIWERTLPVPHSPDLRWSVYPWPSQWWETEEILGALGVQLNPRGV